MYRIISFFLWEILLRQNNKLLEFTVLIIMCMTKIIGNEYRLKNKVNNKNFKRGKRKNTGHSAQSLPCPCNFSKLSFAPPQPQPQTHPLFFQTQVPTQKPKPSQKKKPNLLHFHLHNIYNTQTKREEKTKRGISL